MKYKIVYEDDEYSHALKIDTRADFAPRVVKNKIIFTETEIELSDICTITQIRDLTSNEVVYKHCVCDEKTINFFGHCACSANAV